MGASTQTVMAWSGHAKYDTFKKYIKLSEAHGKIETNRMENYYSEFTDNKKEDLEFWKGLDETVATKQKG